MTSEEKICMVILEAMRGLTIDQLTAERTKVRKNAEQAIEFTVGMIDLVLREKQEARKLN